MGFETDDDVDDDNDDHRSLRLSGCQYIMASSTVSAPRLELQGKARGHDLWVGAERLQVLGLALPLRFAAFRGVPGNPECKERCTGRH